MDNMRITLVLPMRIIVTFVRMYIYIDIFV